MITIHVRRTRSCFLAPLSSIPVGNTVRAPMLVSLLVFAKPSCSSVNSLQIVDLARTTRILLLQSQPQLLLLHGLAINEAQAFSSARIPMHLAATELGIVSLFEIGCLRLAYNCQSSLDK